MHENSREKVIWFKNHYLDTTHKLDILDVGSLDSDGNYNSSDIFISFLLSFIKALVLCLSSFTIP